MKAASLFLGSSIFALLFLSLCAGSTDFWVGASCRDACGPLIKQELSGNAARVELMWGYIIPELKDLELSLTVDSLRANASAIDEWAAQQSWTNFDTRLSAAKGLNIVGAVSECNTQGSQLPRYQGKPVGPVLVGEER
jgi:hypothetical protein